MRLLLIPSILLVVFGGGAACSPTSTPKCSTSTCSGCCDSATGACLAGNNQSGCGSGGLVCSQCGADTFCSVGFCIPGGSNTGGGGGTSTGGGGGVTGGGGGGVTGGGGGTSSCGPQNCGGCCVGGVCQPGNLPSACGSGGESCSGCGSGTCSDNQCTGSTCNPGNCQGCCNGNRCETGLTAAICGSGGLTCSACSSGQSCDNGQCTGGTTCSAQNCVDGCCQGNVCLPGNSTSACGGAGGLCGACTSGQSCSAGQCVGSCNASNCPSGCCQGNVCQAGTSPSACGGGGNTCATCSGSCLSGQCVPDCNPGNCPSGCCQGSVCQAGTSSAACGFGGGTCASCNSNQACNGSACVAVCNGATCPSGCCQGDVCLPGTTGAACGANGAACTTCSGPQTCGSGSCSGGGLPGDGCDTAPLLTLPFSISQSLVGYANDFTSASTNNCRGTQGIDRAVRVSVPNGQRLTVTVTPTVSTFDPTVSLVTGAATACLGGTAMCAASMDTGNANVAETVTWTNATGSAATVYIIVDDYSATGTNGAYTLSASAATPTAGENCASPLSGASGVAVSRSPSAFSDDYQGTGSGCLTPSTGPDFVVAYTVPNNRSLTVTATPASGLDVSLNFATSLAACGSRTCVASANAGATGVAETVGWNNTTGATVTVFAIIDTTGTPVGAVNVLGTEGALLGCGPSTCANGCCSGGTCVAGTASSACGTGGGTCSSCTSPAQCSASQVCSATDLPAGSSCTLTAQCYTPIIGSPECRTSWPGGYCTGFCFLTDQVCSGLPGLATGWCTPANECLQTCAGPGTGQSDCRSSYVCDFSNGSGSQGVCVPRCQQVACSSGSCNAAGYCR